MKVVALSAAMTSRTERDMVIFANRAEWAAAALVPQEHKTGSLRRADIWSIDCGEVSSRRDWMRCEQEDERPM